MPSPSTSPPSSSTPLPLSVRQEGLSSMTAVSSSSSSATNDPAPSFTATSADVTTISSPPVYEYELLRDEPSSPARVIRPSSSRTQGGDGHRQYRFAAPRKSELHSFAFAKDILREVEEELGLDQEADSSSSGQQEEAGPREDAQQQQQQQQEQQES